MNHTSPGPSNSSTGKPVERRRAPRFQADLPLNLSRRDLEAQARLVDISTLGLCCHVPEEVPEMTLVQLRLDLAEGQEFQAEGAVVRCEPLPGAKGDQAYEVGVFFTQVDKASKKCLADYLETKVAAS